MRRSTAKPMKWTTESQKDLQAILKYLKGISAPTQLKSSEELEGIRAHSEELAAADFQGNACWFKNSTGGDYCVSYPPDECVKRGGTPVPGRCPHFFAAMAAATRLSQSLRPGSKAKKKIGKTPAGKKRRS